MADTGSDLRRGPFRGGDRVQLTDPKGRMHTIVLAAGKQFHTHRGHIRHDDLIGQPDGCTLTGTDGTQFLALRPLLADYVMSMPRGAAVVYPKDAGQIVTMADIYPGARVVEAGVGSGALSMSLLRAVGETGSLHSFERRADFAEIAKENARSFFGTDHPSWTVTVGDLVEALPDAVEPGTVDRVVLDMLAPWECLDVVADALAPGGVVICYVATATQLSKVAETMKARGCWTEPHAWETLLRDWHLEGLAVRPAHRMHGHTGFLITSRRLAPGHTPPLRKRRPAKGAYGEAAGDAPSSDPEAAEQARPVAPNIPEGPMAVPDEDWTPEALGERVTSPKRTRRIIRDMGIVVPQA
ncbi:tRNA (adenine-N1)-methyltransferase [Kribbia dieselivorans]|uniref:tRNA (adenine-N1)-methyltransferase n=1 Tax=Kribbia dieselivorans TaxID=331526 RepID=UPI0008382697|nr:tRNA (adenine-N1)-methyltransferase [Kribbia dieselivorans]